MMMDRLWLAISARMHYSMVQCRIPGLPKIRVWETDWPSLWPVRSYSGAMGTCEPEHMFPRKIKNQQC